MSISFRAHARRFGVPIALALLPVSAIGFGVRAEGPVYTGLGDTACRWSARENEPPCNRCVVDVTRQFWTLGARTTQNGPEAGPAGRFTYWSGVGPDDPHRLNLTPIAGRHHIQGFARVPNFLDNNWFVMSRAKRRDPGHAGLLFAQIGAASDSAGHRLAPSGLPDAYWVPNPLGGAHPPPNSDVVRQFVPIDDTTHPGGLQVIGRIVVVPSWCKGGGCDHAFVDFFEIKPCPDDPTNVCPSALPRLFLRRPRGFFDKRFLDKKAYYAAIARMNSGHYVLLINRTDSGKFDIYVSSNATLDASTRWVNRGEQQFSSGFEYSSDTYQNMNFVTDCGGELYLLGFRQDGWGKNNSAHSNRVVLWRAHARKTGKLDLSRIGQVYLRELDDSCELRGGGNVYVSPDGEMIVYCSQGRSRSKRGQDPRFLSFSEY